MFSNGKVYIIKIFSKYFVFFFSAEFGKMMLTMSLYKSYKFDNKFITRDFPVVVDMADSLFVELSMNTTSDLLSIAPQQCYATITDDPTDDFRYSIFKERWEKFFFFFFFFFFFIFIFIFFFFLLSD